MDHPNIAKVLDAGTTEEGLPNFVMQLVKEVTLTESCDPQRLNPRERLEWFNAVCLAVQHAHQKGILHRDLSKTERMSHRAPRLAASTAVQRGGLGHRTHEANRATPLGWSIRGRLRVTEWSCFRAIQSPIDWR